MVSTRPGGTDANLPELSLSGEPSLASPLPPAPRKRRRARPLRVLALALLLAGASMYYLSVARPGLYHLLVSGWPGNLGNARRSEAIIRANARLRCSG